MPIETDTPTSASTADLLAKCLRRNRPVPSGRERRRCAVALSAAVPNKPLRPSHAHTLERVLAAEPFVVAGRMFVRSRARVSDGVILFDEVTDQAARTSSHWMTRDALIDCIESRRLAVAAPGERRHEPAK